VLCARTPTDLQERAALHPSKAALRRPPALPRRQRDERGCATAPAAHRPAGPIGFRPARLGWPAPRGRRSVAGACQVADECTEEFGHLRPPLPEHPDRPGLLLPARLPARWQGRRRCRAVGAAKLLYSTQAGLTDGGSELKLVKFLDFDSSRRLVFFHTATVRWAACGWTGPAAPAEILMRDAVLDAIAYDWTRACCSTWCPTPPTPATTAAASGWLNVDHGGRTPGWPGSPAQGAWLRTRPGAFCYISLWCGARPACTPCAWTAPKLRPLLTGGRGAPGRLALDSEQGRLYWLDMELRGVFSARPLNGSDRRAIWHMGSGYDGIPLGWRSSRTACSGATCAPAPFTPSTNSRASR
uniref:DUF1618 domain-containing protein n=1 Tax=Macrostomum lignano TaxID=282301 RepID=A0A1I8FJ09_9PLAT